MEQCFPLINGFSKKRFTKNIYYLIDCFFLIIIKYERYKVLRYNCNNFDRLDKIFDRLDKNFSA